MPSRPSEAVTYLGPVGRLDRALTGHEPRDSSCVETPARGTRSPLRDELLDTHIAVLGPAGGKGRHLRGVPAGGAVPRERLLDLRASPRECLQHSRRHPVDLRRALLHRPPSHAEACSEFVAERGLVEEARGSRMRVDEPPIERRPLAVGSLDEVGDQDVRVQLRIPRATGPMQERGGSQPVAADPRATASAPPGDRERALEVLERVDHGSLVRLADRRLDALVADPEEHADALGRGEGDVKALDRSAAPELHSTRWIGAGEDRRQLVAGHDPVECERGGAAAEPTAGRLAPAHVVVLSARCQRGGLARVRLGLVEVVAGLSGLELADGDHRLPSR